MRHEVEHRRPPLVAKFPHRQELRDIANRNRLQGRRVGQSQLHPLINLQKNARQIPSFQIITRRLTCRTPPRKPPLVLPVIAMHPARRQNPQDRLHLLGSRFQLRIQLLNHQGGPLDLTLRRNPLSHRSRSLRPFPLSQGRFLDFDQQLDLRFRLILAHCRSHLLPLSIPWTGSQGHHQKTNPY